MPAFDRGLQARDHLGGGDDLLAREVAAELGRDLVLDLHAGGSSPRDRMHGGRGIAPAGVDVHEQGKVHSADNPVDVGQDVTEVGFTGVRQAEGLVGNAGAGKVERLKASALGEQRGIGVDHAGNLQGFFRLERGAEFLAGGHVGRKNRD